MADFVMAIYWKMPRCPCMGDTWFRITQWGSAAVKRNKKDLYPHSQLTRSEKQQGAEYYQAIKHLNVFVCFYKNMQET